MNLNHSLLLVFITILLFGVYKEYTAPFDDTDEQPHRAFHRSGLGLKVDHGTGCEYITWFGGITPRLDVNGKPICGRKP